MKTLEHLNLHRPTIARDLTLSLIGVLTFVFFVAAVGNFYYSTKTDGDALEKKADEIMDNLTSVLVTPMWNLNTTELKKIVDIYMRHSDIVIDIRVVDETGKDLVPTPSSQRIAFKEKFRRIYYNKNPLGHVSVTFSDAAIVAKQKEFALYSIFIFGILSLAITLATSLLLRRFLTQPVIELKQGLDIISSGSYDHHLKDVRQQDVNDITQKVNDMARQISRRETALEANHAKLEVLNQAILDIFSCSNTDTLIRTAMSITHKVCNVDHGWFLGTSDTSATGEEDNDTTPVPLVCVRGHTFEASEKEVAVHMGANDEKTNFTFDITSRHRRVGEVTLAFDDSPDKATVSLLRSIMSLITLAQTRQSFIRETAFISAELQVAETVQKSMLPEEHQLPKNATIAFYYEPVLRVGGDWFSIIESYDHRYLYIIMGDVTGHGLAQGLITTAMAGAINIVESTIHKMKIDMNPSDIVNQLSEVVSKITGKSNLRMTLVAARLDLQENKILVTNAGHTFPLVLKNLGDKNINVGSLAKNQQHMLGEDSLRSKEVKYTDAEYDMDENDYLVFFTDGLTEALSKEGKAFNRKFLRHLSKSEAGKTVAQTLDNIMRTFETHTSDVPVNDDICVVVIGKKQVEGKLSSGAA